MELCERIALARKQAGLSQEQLGEKLGVSRQAVSKWESGQTNPDVAYVAEMCRLFGVSSDWLLLGEESSQEAAPARCPGCQAVVTGLDQFCPNCGRNLKNPASNTYTLLLRPVEYSFTLGDDLYKLSRTGWFSEASPLGRTLTQEEADQLVGSAPLVLERGLSQMDVKKVLNRVIHADCFTVYRDQDGDSPEELSAQEPVDTSRFSAAQEPLSFGMVVLAVIIGIIASILILSFL